MAEKTVKQLQAEYNQITEENRKAYDNLKGYGSGVFSWQNEYQKLLAKANPSDKDKARLAELKPKFDAAQAEYKKTQEAKNALKKELEAAKKAETEAKQGDVSKKSAQSNYDKAIASLNVATAQLGGYKGDEGYIDAYKKAKVAADALTKAGGTPSLPEPKITIPAAGSDTTKTGAGGTAEDMPLADRINFLNPDNSLLNKILLSWLVVFPKLFR